MVSNLSQEQQTHTNNSSATLDQEFNLETLDEEQEGDEKFFRYMWRDEDEMTENLMFVSLNYP